MKATKKGLEWENPEPDGYGSKNNLLPCTPGPGLCWLRNG